MHCMIKKPHHKTLKTIKANGKFLITAQSLHTMGYKLKARNDEQFVKSSATFTFTLVSLKEK